MANCEESLRAGHIIRADRSPAESWPLVPVPELQPSDLIRAGTELASAVCDMFSGRGDLPAPVVETLAEGVAALTQSLTRWTQPGGPVAGTPAASRRWLAREIHDWLGNGLSLTLRRLDLYEIHRDRAAFSAADAEISVVRHTLADLLQGARSLASGLRRDIPEVRLVDALRSWVKAAEPTGMLVEVDVQGDEELLPPGYRAELFAVVREGLRNALAHSRASNVAARIDIADGTATAVVEDDGIGLPAGVDPASAGLASMRERAELLGAEFRVTDAVGPPGGTRLFLRLPIPERSDVHA